MAALAHDLKVQAETIRDLWLNLKPDDIYRRDLKATLNLLVTSAAGILRNLLTLNPFKIGVNKGPRFYSFLDTAPLWKFLKKSLPLQNLSRNISHGPVDAAALVATNLDDGASEIFLQKKSHLLYSGNYRIRKVELGIKHAIASAAIPIIFPAVQIDDRYYSDGGLRMFTPLSPAVQLGAKRLLVVELQPHGRKKEVPPPKYTHRPTFAYQMGRLLNGLFQDRVDFDLQQVEKINDILEAGESLYGPKFSRRLNRRLNSSWKKYGTSFRGLSTLQVFQIAPSFDLSEIFRDWFKREDLDFDFTLFEDVLIRLLDIDPLTGEELLGYLIFAPDYLKQLFDVGFQDALKKRHELIDLFDN